MVPPTWGNFRAQSSSSNCHHRCEIVIETLTKGEDFSSAGHPGPTIAHQPLLGPEAGLIRHLGRSFGPIAEIDIRRAHALGAADAVQCRRGGGTALLQSRSEEG